MRITTWAEYGLFCALHLARRAGEGPVTGRDIAAREKLPGDYVDQILLRMRRAEIVISTRGARGGYALARDAGEISVRDVIQASELATFDLHCVLESAVLSDLLADEASVRGRVGLSLAGPRGVLARDGELLVANPHEAPSVAEQRHAALPLLQS